MFMTPALTSITRETDSGFGLMHLNALNGSTSVISESSFGPRHYVNDEHISATFFENFKYYSKDSLKSPALGRLRATSPVTTLPRSKARSPYLPRKSTKCNKYEVESDGVSDETMQKNLLKNNFTKNKLDVKDCHCKPEKEVKTKKKLNSIDIRVTKSLNFDSLSLCSSPCKENHKSSKRGNKLHRCETN